MSDQITSHNYVERAMRTDTPITPELIERMSNPQTIRLLHAAIGMATEAGELLDMLKKHLFYGRKLDLVNAKEECGDGVWYSALAIDVMQTTMNEIMTMNINKLRLRYPEKFTEECAIDRNVEAERELLEAAIEADRTGVELVVKPDAYDAYYQKITRKGSQQAEDFIKFAAEVVEHIEMYVVPQYGDKDTELAKDWSPQMLLEQAKKYIDRFGRNSRPGQEWLDFLKAAHYVQKAATKFKEEGGCK